MGYHYNEFGQFVYKTDVKTIIATRRCGICGKDYQITTDNWWSNYFYCSSQCCGVRREQLKPKNNDRHSNE